MKSDVLPVLKAGRYRHYKNKDYAVFRVARHSETEAVVVVYRQLYGEYGWWVRPYEMFVEEVLVAGKMLPRFVYVGPLDESCIQESKA
jgi:hypothetical protein